MPQLQLLLLDTFHLPTCPILYCSPSHAGADRMWHLSYCIQGKGQRKQQVIVTMPPTSQGSLKEACMFTSLLSGNPKWQLYAVRIQPESQILLMWHPLNEQQAWEFYQVTGSIASTHLLITFVIGWPSKCLYTAFHNIWVDPVSVLR